MIDLYLTPAERADKLLGWMTLTEKACQVSAVMVSELLGPAGFREDAMQPHLLYLLELLYRAKQPAERAALIPRFAELAEETYDAATTENPTFELAYWRWGLEIAQRCPPATARRSAACCRSTCLPTAPSSPPCP